MLLLGPYIDKQAPEICAFIGSSIAMGGHRFGKILRKQVYEIPLSQNALIFSVLHKGTAFKMLFEMKLLFSMTIFIIAGT